MGEHGTFHYRTLEELEAHVAALGLDLPFDQDLSPLARPVNVGGRTAPNALAVHPMEGCDGEADGSPGPLTRRRYLRFAAGGAGLLWFEACAVVREGRANPRQVWLNRTSAPAFVETLRDALAAGRDARGASHRPLVVLQLTHSGRFSRPEPGPPRPITPQRNPYLDPLAGLGPDAPVIPDMALEALEDAYVDAARLAREVGFDGVDVKACHGYLVNELLGARRRENSVYGGDYEGRTRFLRNVVGKIRAAVPYLLVAVRLNVYDAVPWPYGWGVAENGDGRVPDLDEPARLACDLAALGAPLLGVSAGNPYYNPHIGRPFDMPTEGAYTPDEHPLEGVARLLGFARSIQREAPGAACVGTGFSWLRQFLPFAAAAAVRRNGMAFAGVGREAFAFPDFAARILDGEGMPSGRVCIACSSCTQLMRDGSVTGCVPRDKSVYAPVFAEGRRKNPGARRLPHPVAAHITTGKG